jgi:hypothetical protein
VAYREGLEMVSMQTDRFRVEAQPIFICFRVALLGRKSIKIYVPYFSKKIRRVLFFFFPKSKPHHKLSSGTLEPCLSLKIYISSAFRETL